MAAGCLLSAGGAVFSRNTLRAALYICALFIFTGGTIALLNLSAMAGLIALCAGVCGAAGLTVPLRNGSKSDKGDYNENRFAVLPILAAAIGATTSILIKLPAGGLPPAASGAAAELFTANAAAAAAIALTVFVAVTAAAHLAKTSEMKEGDTSESA